jgi:hypothetical protein
VRPALVIAVLLGTSVPAGAQPKDPPVSEEAAKERARVLLEAGNQLSDSNDHLGALEMFRQARAAYPSIFLHINIGVSLWNLGRYTQALDELEAFLAAPGAPEEDKVTVREQIAKIEPVIGILTVTFTPPAVTLTVAGRTIKVTGGRAVLRFDPGEHLVVVYAEGYESKTHKVSFKGGERLTATITLELPPPPPKPEVIERVIEKAPPLRPTQQRVGAAARVVVDPGGPGAAMVVAGTYGVTRFLDINLGGIVGGSQGGYLGATVFLLPGAFRPLLSAGAPAFAADGLRLGVRGAAGLEWRVADWIGITGEVGVEHYPSVPDDHVKTLFAPSVGVQARR